MSYHDKQYLDLVKYALDNGVYKGNRTGIGTYSVFGYQMRFNLRDGTIPMLTTKKMHTRSIIHELLWYLQGTGNIKYLQENGVRIWNEWADKNGDLGPVYGVMWRGWPTMTVVDQEPGGLLHCIGDEVDQIANLIHSLKNNPNDRRMLVTAWNPAVLPDTGISFDENVANGKQALPPCHYSFQCWTRPLTEDQLTKQAIAKYGPEVIRDITHEKWRGDDFWKQTDIPMHEMSLMLNQRSCDIGLGVPFNIVQYSLLMRMLCEVANMTPGDFIWNGGDVHIYENHLDALRHQITLDAHRSPTFKFARKIDDINDFKFEDFVISDYTSHPVIKMDVAV